MNKLALTLTCALVACAAHAQPWPSRPIRVVVPFPAGGPVDITARVLSPQLTHALGQTMVVDNRAGASSIIGSDIVAKAPPDGHTLLICSTTNTINASVMPKLPFDMVRDFAPVSLIAIITSVLVVHPAVPAQSVKELIALAKAKPGQLTYASAGNASPSHLAGELLKALAGIDIVHVPYKGGAPAAVDQLSGQVQLSLLSAPAVMPHIKSGKLRALGVTNARRSLLLPELPTIAESGLPGYVSESWHGMAAPALTAPAIVARLHREIAAALQLPEVRAKLISGGAEPVGLTPEAFGKKIVEEIERWRKVVKASGLKVD